MLRFRRFLLVVAVFLLLSCPILAFADFGDEATLGGHDSDGNYRWRVTSSGHFRPGNTDGDADVGTSTAPVGEVHMTTVYKEDGWVTQGFVKETALGSAAAATLTLDSGVYSKTLGTGYEVLTVPVGTVAGTEISISLLTDGGGHFRINPATTSNFTGIAMTDALDHVTLRWVDATVGWIIVGEYGVTVD